MVSWEKLISQPHQIRLSWNCAFFHQKANISGALSWTSAHTKRRLCEASKPISRALGIINTTIPDQQSLRRASKTSLSSMSRAFHPDQKAQSSQWLLADVTACSLPANTSKKSFLEAERNGGSDELASAGVCDLGGAQGLLWRAQGKAGVELAFTGMGNCEGCVGGQAGRSLAARSCASPRSGLFHVCLLWSMAGCFCWQPMMAHTCGQNGTGR